MIKRKYIISGVMCLMLAVSGCGKAEPEIISDYGNITEQTVSESVQSKNENNSEERNPEEGDSDTVSHDLFGTGSVQWGDTFTSDDQKVNINVNISYEKKDVKSLPVYNYNSLKADSLHEEDIVKNLFGENAEKIAERNLAAESEDSLKLIQSYRGFLFMNDSRQEYDNAPLPAWTQNDDYFVHTYEGVYRNTDCQLIIGYNYNTDTAFFSMYPKNPGSMIGHPEYEWSEVTGLDTEFMGMPIFYEGPDGAENDSDEILLTNKCTLSKESQINTAFGFLKDYLLLDINPDCLSTDQAGSMGQSSVSTEQNEIEYFTKVPEYLGDTNSECVERNGYYINILNMISGFNIHAEDVNSYNQGGIYVDDGGVIGFNIILNECLLDKQLENTSVLSFENLKSSFKSIVAEKLDTDKIKSDNLFFTDMDIEYMRDSSDSETGSMVPALHLTAIAEDGFTIPVQVYINMIDGSLIDIVY